MPSHSSTGPPSRPLSSPSRTVHLKRTRTAGFGLRVIIATALGIALGLIAQGHTQYVGVFGVIWSQVIAALVVPLLLFSVFSSVTNLGDSLRLRGMAVKTVVFLLLNTLTASLLTLGLASASASASASSSRCPPTTSNARFPASSTRSSTCSRRT